MKIFDLKRYYHLVKELKNQASQDVKRETFATRVYNLDLTKNQASQDVKGETLQNMFML